MRSSWSALQGRGCLGESIRFDIDPLKILSDLLYFSSGCVTKTKVVMRVLDSITHYLSVGLLLVVQPYSRFYTWFERCLMHFKGKYKKAPTLPYCHLWFMSHFAFWRNLCSKFIARERERREKWLKLVLDVLIPLGYLLDWGFWEWIAEGSQSNSSYYVISILDLSHTHNICSRERVYFLLVHLIRRSLDNFQFHSHDHIAFIHRVNF